MRGSVDGQLLTGDIKGREVLVKVSQKYSCLKKAK
jgi:hypothetical protein